MEEIDCYFSNIRDRIVDRIDLATTRIQIAMAWFTNPVIYDVVLSRAAAGIEVELLISDSEANFRPGSSLDFSLLAKKKMKVSVFKTVNGKFMHHKFSVIDDMEVMTGSYNFSNNAQTNIENMISIRDAGKARIYGAHFQWLLDNTRTVSLSDFLSEIATTPEVHNQLEDIALFELSKQFEYEILKATRDAEELKIGLRMGIVENMIQRYGVIGAAARLSNHDPQPGFVKLIEVNRYDLTFEYFTSMSKYAPLFDKSTIANAKEKLRPYLQKMVDRL